MSIQDIISVVFNLIIALLYYKKGNYKGCKHVEGDIKSNFFSHNSMAGHVISTWTTECKSCNRMLIHCKGHIDTEPEYITTVLYE